MGGVAIRRNRRAPGFKKLFECLPKHIQELAKAAFDQFLRDPSHTSLRRHNLKDNDKGNHKKGSISVSFSSGYRAIYVEVGDTNVWYWIGTHSDYNTFTGKK